MKAFWKSKTLWVNAAGLALYALDKFAGIHAVDPNTLIPAILTANTGLRFATSQPIGATDQP